MSVVTTGQITVTDQNDGVSAKLSLESFVAPTAPDGSSPVLTGASTTVAVFIGATDDSSNWVVSAAPSSGVTGTLSGRTYTVTGLTVDAGFVDLTASKNAYSSVTMRFAVSKAKKGNRGTVSAARAISASAWSNTEAATAISDLTSDTPVDGDVVTLYNSTATYSETRQRSGSTWVALSQYLNGNLVVNGTIVGDKLAADSITASKVLIEDNSNIVPDADYEDIAAWVLDSSNTTETVVAATSEWNSANLLRVDAASNVLGVVRGKTFKVRPGDKLFWEGQSMVNGGTGTCYYQIYFSSSRSMSSPTAILMKATTSTVPLTASGEITVPTGVRFGQIRLVKNSTGATSALFGRIVLRKKADAELIVDGSVVAAKIATDAVEADKIKADAVVAGKIAANAVNAREIASQAITTEKMAIRSLNNLLENPDFENGALHWTNPTRIINDPANALRGSWVYTYVSPNATAAIVSQSNIIEAMPGDSFYMRGSFKNSTGSSGSWYIQARFLDDANTAISTQNLVWSGVNTTWSEKECIVTAPANATRLRVLLYSLGSGTLYWDGLSLMKAADGKLIVDGSVVATKIAADAVTASHLDSDSLGVAGLAVFGGTLKSDDFVTGVSGWRILSNGNAEMNSIIVRSANLENTAATRLRESLINNTTTYSSGASWNSIGTFTFTPYETIPFVVWMTMIGTITLGAGVFGDIDIRILWRGVSQVNRLGTMSAVGSGTFKSMLSIVEKIESGGATSGTLELQARCSYGSFNIDNVRILVGEFRK